jgi:anti-sigma factor RsiW
VSGCRFEDLEAFVFDELGRERAAAVQAHITSCARCAREVGCLRAERQVFAGRAPAARASLPAFDQVLDRSRAIPPKRPAIARLWSAAWGRRDASAAGRGSARAGTRRSAVGIRAHTALAMCSAMAVLVLAVRATHYERAAPPAPSQLVPSVEPLTSAPETRGLACYEADPILVEECSGAADKSTGSVEDEYGACLVATPVSAVALTCDAPPL